jgi:hypothetical protein
MAKITAGVIKLKILRWEIILVYMGVPNVTTGIPLRGAEGQSQRRKCDGENRLEDGRGSLAKKCRWQRKGWILPLELPEGTQPYQHLCFRTTGIKNYTVINFHCF